MNTNTYPRPDPMFARSPLASAAIAIVLIFAVVTVFVVCLP